MKVDVRRSLPGAFLCLLVVAGVLVAINSDGYKTNKADLHDPGIWITRSRGFSGVGRVNSDISNAIDAMVSEPADTDVLQAGATVLVRKKGALATLDAANAREVKDATANVGNGADVGLGGTTLGVLDGGRERKLRVIDATSLTQASFEEEPAAQFSGTARMAVGVDGLIHVVDGETVTTFSSTGSKTSERKLSATTEKPQITAVGSRAVVFDEGTHSLLLPNGKRVDLSRHGANAKLQQPGPDSGGVVAVETDDELIDVDLSSGTAHVRYEHASGGSIQPVRLEGCSYGAWENAGDSVSVIACGDKRRTETVHGEGARSLVFRVNRNRVFLNNIVDGSATALDTNPPQTITSDAWNTDFQRQPDQEKDPNSPEQQIVNRSQSDAPPTAEDFSINARPAIARTIKVLAHTTHATHVVSVSDPPGGIRGKVAIGLNAQTIEYTPPPDTPGGDATFDYVVANNKGEQTTPHRITVRLVPPPTNTPPTVGVVEARAEPGGVVTVSRV